MICTRRHTSSPNWWFLSASRHSSTAVLADHAAMCLCVCVDTRLFTDVTDYAMLASRYYLLETGRETGSGTLRVLHECRKVLKMASGSTAQWLAHLEFELGDPGSIPGSCHYIPLGSNLGQVVNSHCLPSFSAPRNRGTKREFSAPKWLWWLSAPDY